MVFGTVTGSYSATVNLPGGYNIYNACACMAAGGAMGLSDQTVAESLSRFQCGFGRMEKFDINGTPVRMILIKNPRRLQPGAELPDQYHHPRRICGLPQ